MNKHKSLAAVALALLLASGCGTAGDILGGGNDNYEIRGTVDYVDPASRSVYLTNVSGYTSMLSGAGSGNSVRVYYEDTTPVEYQGRQYRVQDLERGDQVVMRVDEQGNQLVADSVTVTYNANTGSGTSTGAIGSTLRGTVRHIDTSRRQVEVDTGLGSTVLVDYATNTPVYWNGRTYSVGNLERGDEVEIRVNNLGSGRYSANEITVLRSMASSSGSSFSTLRGTVRAVDTSRRTIELESTSWVSGFANGGGSITVVKYDANAGVEFQGRLHPLSNLERGDVVDVQVENLSGSLLARRITLVRDVRSF